MQTIIEEKVSSTPGEAVFAPTRSTPDISVFLPVFNEEPNLRPLHETLNQALAQLGRSAEIIYVDDGSSDGSLNILREIASQDSRARVNALRPNYGPTPAVAQGDPTGRGP